MTSLSLSSVCKAYGELVALEDVSLAFTPNCITAIIGRSGCGKSTLLRMCNGLTRPDSGEVMVFQQALDYASLPALRKRIGYAVQGTGLFPHLTVRANISLLAELENWSKPAIDQRLEQLLTLTQLQQSHLAKYPHQLSGGQQQRVGLCRAMMLSPELLLLDEPFAAIDPLTRMDIQEQLLALHEAEPVTTVLVTHDMQEALLLADEIVIMEAGRVVQAISKTRLLEQYPGQEPNRLLLSLMAGAGA
ncbi:MAG: ATP-binding cassette domain-containing protein [Gammaproteobacteria bacterium]|nr:ATP-binding cassette domain-containing protein [Gammaproteobacteria bacterium]